MIQGLFETHLAVTSLEKAIDFYENTLGLQKCHVDTTRRIAFFWIGKPQEAMLGLWENASGIFDRRHFSFRCNADTLLKNWRAYFRERDLQPYNFLENEEGPLVFAWMPAVAIYFKDPDGNELEFISILEGSPRPELGIISYAEWKRVSGT
jgi:catechol-2,3-dioxygenase